jgi:hypothetical protein
LGCPTGASANIGAEVACRLAADVGGGQAAEHTGALVRAHRRSRRRACSSASALVPTSHRFALAPRRVSAVKNSRPLRHGKCSSGPIYIRLEVAMELCSYLPPPPRVSSQPHSSSTVQSRHEQRTQLAITTAQMVLTPPTRCQGLGKHVMWYRHGRGRCHSVSSAICRSSVTVSGDHDHGVRNAPARAEVLDLERR